MGRNGEGEIKKNDRERGRRGDLEMMKLRETPCPPWFKNKLL